jgi:hypothetical protein
MTLSRHQITTSLVDDIQSWPFSIACWEGGSAANQLTDPYSDLDLVICVENGKTEEAFSRIQNQLGSLSKIDHIWRVPAPTWHGHGQCFFKLSHTPEHFFLDIVVMEEKATQKFLEKERHGTPVVYFDKKNFVQIKSADTAEFRSKRDQRFESIKASFPFIKTLVQKEIARKRPIDALAFYRSFVSFYVELLGMKHRPFRYDFGLRYAYFDFPTEIQTELEKFNFVANLNEIERRLPEVESQIQQLLSELKTPS